MAKKHAIVRRLLSVETLGCTTVICSDKTGTLTTNEMTVTRAFLFNEKSKITAYHVEGDSYRPEGRVKATSCLNSTLELRWEVQAQPFPHIRNEDKGWQALATVMALCNDSTLKKDDESDRYYRIGEPTEAALRVLVEKLGVPDEKLNKAYLQNMKRTIADPFNTYWKSKYTKLATLEFARDRKSMSVLVFNKETQQNDLLVKGAPESLLKRSTHYMTQNGQHVPMTPEINDFISMELEAMGSKALRLIGIAVRLNASEFDGYDGTNQHPKNKLLADIGMFGEIETNLVFAGVVGLIDPPRAEVAEAIEECREAGIRVIMITGDNKKTAEAIAQSIGILPEGFFVDNYSYTGQEFDVLSEDEKIRVLQSSSLVLSRTEPKHKQSVVKLLKDLGEVTAMTGDGVNDAPALKMADIGIAMGITGSEVAKEASDMILTDDNFSSIVTAVEEGRSIYDNMRAFIRYLISSNIGEVASIFFTAALGIPEGLAPVQLLWVNLVTDGPPATALGFNPPDVNVMSKPPRSRNEPLITSWIFTRYLIIGLYVGFATVGIFVSWYLFGVDPSDNNTTISFSQLIHWTQCHQWEDFAPNVVYGMTEDPCSYFTVGKIKASTLSLTVLVVIEMLNALNALSLDGSLLHLPPWSNPWLCYSILGSLGIHGCILNIGPLGKVFNVVPLSLYEWAVVLLWSLPVIFIDELIKSFARGNVQRYNSMLRKARSIEMMSPSKSSSAIEFASAQKGNNTINQQQNNNNNNTSSKIRNRP